MSRVNQAFALVFLRDWHPVLRDPLDLFRLSFPVGAVIYARVGDWDAAVRLAAPGFAVFLVRAINVPRPIDWVFGAAMFFQGLLGTPSAYNAMGGAGSPTPGAGVPPGYGGSHGYQPTVPNTGSQPSYGSPHSAPSGSGGTPGLSNPTTPRPGSSMPQTDTVKTNPNITPGMR